MSIKCIVRYKWFLMHCCLWRTSNNWGKVHFNQISTICRSTIHGFHCIRKRKKSIFPSVNIRTSIFLKVINILFLLLIVGVVNKFYRLTEDCEFVLSSF